jgi:hypothetical protein
MTTDVQVPHQSHEKCLERITRLALRPSKRTDMAPSLHESWHLLDCACIILPHLQMKKGNPMDCLASQSDKHCGSPILYLLSMHVCYVEWAGARGAACMRLLRLYDCYCFRLQGSIDQIMRCADAGKET